MYFLAKILVNAISKHNFNRNFKISKYTILNENKFLYVFISYVQQNCNQNLETLKIFGNFDSRVKLDLFTCLTLFLTETLSIAITVVLFVLIDCRF